MTMGLLTFGLMTLVIFDPQPMFMNYNLFQILDFLEKFQVTIQTTCINNYISKLFMTIYTEPQKKRRILKYYSYMNVIL